MSRAGRPSIYTTEEERKSARAVTVAKAREKAKKQLDEARRVLNGDTVQNTDYDDLRELVTQQAKAIELLQSQCKQQQEDLNLLSSLVVVKTDLPEYF